MKLNYMVIYNIKKKKKSKNKNKKKKKNKKYIDILDFLCLNYDWYNSTTYKYTLSK